MPMTLETAEPDGGQPSKAKVFISYSRKDVAFADRLEAALKARGFEPLIDRSEIYAFEDWWKRIEALIAGADTLVFVLSPDSAASEVARKEVAFAASLNKRFAPIVFRPVSNEAVPEALAKLNFAFFDDEARFEACADRLAEALDTDIDWIRQHTAFGEQARQWALARAPGGLLLRSPVLEQAERWIAARPRTAPAPTEETQVFIRASRQGATRRRNILTGSLAAGLVLALGLAGLAYWQRGLAVEQRAIAERNETQAKEERDKATRNFRLAQQTADRLVFDIAQGLRNVQGMRAETVRRILETARGTFEQLAASAPDDPSLQRSRAAMLAEFGNAYLTLGDVEQALKLYRDSLDIAQQLAIAEAGNPRAQRDLLASHLKVGDARMAQGRLADALSSYREGLAICERLLAADRDNADWQRDLSLSQQKVADALVAKGELDDALAAYRGSLAVAERLADADRSNAVWQRSLWVAYNKVAILLQRQGKDDEALKVALGGLAIAERLAAADPANTQSQRDLSISHDIIGSVHRSGGRLTDALKSFRDALAIRQHLAAGDPGNTDWQRDVTLSYERIGDVLEAERDLDGALQAHRQGLAVAQRLAAADPANIHIGSAISRSHMCSASPCWPRTIFRCSTSCHPCTRRSDACSRHKATAAVPSSHIVTASR
jgi:tetratricopeptide (TPR) repeat protein